MTPYPRRSRPAFRHPVVAEPPSAPAPLRIPAPAAALRRNEHSASQPAQTQAPPAAIPSSSFPHRRFAKPPASTAQPEHTIPAALHTAFPPPSSTSSTSTQESPSPPAQ